MPQGKLAVYWHHTAILGRLHWKILTQKDNLSLLKYCICSMLLPIVDSVGPHLVCPQEVLKERGMSRGVVMRVQALRHQVRGLRRATV